MPTPLYVRNPNYNPLDPRSNRYVTDPQAQQEATTKASTLNDIFAPFTSMSSGLFKPYTPQSFYAPLPTPQIVPNITPAGTAAKTPAPTGAAPATPAPSISTPQTGGTYAVRAGDTLSTIAARNGTTVGALAAANGITDPNRIQIGQVLRIGGGAAAPVAGNAAAPQPQGGIQVPAAPTRLTTAEIAAMAEQAGKAGMSADDFMAMLKQNSATTSTEAEAIRTKLGIPNLVDEAFKRPDKSTIDQYREMYDLAGLRDIQTKIAAVDDSIAKKRADLLTATGELNNNPWISQSTRQGRLKNLQDLAYADIQNDLDRKQQYLDIYDSGVNQIETQLGYITADAKDSRQLSVDKLNYLLNEAERMQANAEQDSITTGLRNVPEFLQGALSREATQQARELEKIRANKAPSGGGIGGLLQMLADGGDSTSAESIVKASAGGKATTDTFRTSYEKTLNTLAQLNDLSKAFTTYKSNTGKNGIFALGAESDLTAPIMGIIRSANPYDTKAQQIKAQLQSIVPNLARGVYGEVGVLTDQDIANYTQTLPNLKSTKEVRDALLAITAKSVYRSLENKLLVQAKGGVDVSGYYTDLQTMRGLTDNLLTQAGVPTESPVTGGSGYSSGDADYVKSLGL